MEELIEGGPALVASTCSRCQLVAFPAEPYGCERCGAPAAELGSTALDPHGTVRGIAVVHRHQRPQPATPFVVVDVELDAGPMVTAVLADRVDDIAAIGARVQGVTTADGFRFIAGGGS